MALDNVELDNLQPGDDVATDLISTDHYQLVKLTYGALGTANVVTDTATNPFPVALSDTDNAVLDQIEVNTSYGDNTGNGTASGSLRVTIASDTTGVLSVDDNAGSLTIDNTNLDNGHSADFDSGAGTDTTTAFGIAVPASGGAAVVPGDATAGLKVDLGADNDVTNAGTFAVQVDGDALTALQLIDDAIYTDDADWTDSTSKHLLAGGIYQSTMQTITDGDTGPLQVDANGQLKVALSATDNTVLDNIQTALETIDNIVHPEDSPHNTGDSGVPAWAVRQDSQSNFGADGDYVPLSVDANGAVRVTGGGGGTEYTADVAAPVAPVGNAQMFERDDALSTLTEVEGDWIQARCSAEGALWTQDFNSDAQLTSLQNIENAIGGTHVDDAAFTPGTDDGVPIFAAFDDTTPDSVDEGDAGILRMSANRNLYSTIRDAAGNERGANVDVNNNLNTILAANSGVDIGDVDVTSVVPGTGATNLGKAEDAAHTTGDVGVMALGVRQDTQVDFGADGDYVPLSIDAAGAVRVTGGGGGTQYTIGTDTYLEGTTIGTMAGAVRNDTLATLASLDNEVAPLQVNASGALYTAVDGTVTVGSHDVTNAGTFAVQISDTSFAVADGNALGEGVLIQGDDGTDRKNINVDATTGDVQVDVTNTVTVGSHDVTNAGTFATQVDGAALTALQLIDNPVLAHDTAVGTTQVSMAGARASNSVEGITQVANGDGTRIAADLNGVLLSRPHTTPEEHISERISNTNGTSTAFTNFAAGGAGIHNYVCDVTITNTSATDAYVDLRDGAAGSIIWTFPAPANSGATHSFSLPLKGAANTALAYDVSAAITTMYISVNGFQAQG